MPSPKQRWSAYVERSHQDWGSVHNMLSDDAISEQAMHKAVDIILAVLENGLPGSPSFSYQPYLGGNADRLGITFSYSGGARYSRIATCVIDIHEYNNGIGISELWLSDVRDDECGWYPEAVM